jgi:5'-deoxynucleotidase YfbR-like HD superfamily hydrolase
VSDNPMIPDDSDYVPRIRTRRSETIDNFTRLYWMRRFAGTKRFHNQPFIGEQTVGHHSSNVALILLVTEDYPSANLLKAALLHDLEEGETGDLPAIVKWSMSVEGLSRVEAEVRTYYQFPGVVLNNTETKLLNAADFIDAVFTCLDQRRLGNLGVDRMFRAYQQFEASTDVLTVSVKMQQIWGTILAAYDHYAYQKAPINPHIEEAEKLNYWKTKRENRKEKP